MRDKHQTRRVRVTSEPRGQQQRHQRTGGAPPARPTSTDREEARTHSPSDKSAPVAAPAPLYHDVARDLGYDPMPGTS